MGGVSPHELGEFAARRPDLADAGRELFYQYGVGLAFLATTRPGGGPRVHPMCPLLTAEELYAFIVPSPKRNDLHRGMEMSAGDETAGAGDRRPPSRPRRWRRGVASGGRPSTDSRAGQGIPDRSGSMGAARPG